VTYLPPRFFFKLIKNNALFTEQYIAENNPQGLTNFLTQFGYPNPQSMDDVNYALDQLHKNYGMEFLYAFVNATHPDREVILKSFIAENSRNAADEIINKGFMQAVTAPLVVKVVGIGLISYLVVRGLTK